MSEMMRTKRAAFVLALAMGSAFIWACSSSSSDSNAAAATSAQGIFEQKVFPALQPTCKGCHVGGERGAPVFLTGAADTTYTAIAGFPGLIASPNNSPIIQKGPHSGPGLTTDQVDVVTQWLKQEAIERKLSDDPGEPQNLRAAFKAFGACMDYNRWIALKLDTLALNTTENNQGQCMSCHNFGMASMWLSGDSAVTFLKLREFPYVQRLVVGSVDDKGEFAGLSFSRRILDKGTEAQQPQSNSHPRYSFPSDLTANLTTFVNETLDNLSAGRCQNVTTPDAGLEGGM
jgi:hypothetical protein